MFSVTGPVTSRPSAWRGEATNWMPKRPRSQHDRRQHVDVGLAAVAAAGAHLAQLERAAEELAALLVERRREADGLLLVDDEVLPSAAHARGGSRRRKLIAPVGQASAHSPQKRQRPRSTASSGLERGSRRSGQASAQLAQPAAQRARRRAPGGRGSARAAPAAALPGSESSGASGGVARVAGRTSARLPRSEVVPAVGEVEALVAEREVGDLPAAQRQASPLQLWNEGSTTL